RDPGVTVETVPGITALQDLAARSGTVLAEGTESLVLLPLTAGPGALAEALAAHDTVVAYKLSAAGPLETVRKALARAGRLDGAEGGGHGDVRGGRARGAGPAERGRGRRDRRSRRGDLGVQPGAPRGARARPARGGDHRLGGAAAGGRADGVPAGAG